MRSLYDDILEALTDHTFTIPNVNIREPYNESAKVYPLIVVHEIVNIGAKHATVTGEGKTTLSYQFDIQTTKCVDDDSVVLSAWKAGRRLESEVNDLLDSTFKFTRRTRREESIGADVLSIQLRGDCVLDSNGYSYRP
jgi:hypothetical protein